MEIRFSSVWVENQLGLVLVRLRLIRNGVSLGWALLSPPLQFRRGDSLKPPSQTTSPAAIRWFPLPPPAAPAAGGWGNPGSRRVYKVGVSRLPAGRAVETAARLVRRFGAEVVVFGGGALVSSAADLPPCACLQFPGAVWCAFPSPDSVVRRIRAFEDLEGDGDAQHGDAGGGAGWRFLGTEDRRLPVRRGATSDPRRLWRSGGGAPAARSALRQRRRDLAGLKCNFPLFLDLSVRTVL